MFRAILIALPLAILLACEESANFQFVVNTDGLVANAIVDTSPRDFQPGKVRYSGTISIENTADRPQPYSNEWLWLSRENGPEARAFLGNLTSHHIDVATVELEPGETLEIPVYWVFDEADGTTLFDGSVALELRPKD